MAFEMIIFIRPHYDCDAASKKARAPAAEQAYAKAGLRQPKGQRANPIINRRNWSRKSICSSLLILLNRSRNGQFQWKAISLGQMILKVRFEVLT